MQEQGKTFTRGGVALEPTSFWGDNVVGWMGWVGWRVWGGVM